MSDRYLLDLDVRDLSAEVIDPEGMPRVMPASFYSETTREERGVLCVRYGLYLLPTVELVDWLRAFIGQRSAIEIGAGNGRLAMGLGIPATDRMLQDDPEVKAFYNGLAQPTVHYGHNVERLDSKAAIRKFRPQVVVGAWVTHRYSRRRHAAGGNQYGPDTDWILQRCEQYVLIGNDNVHRQHPLWSRRHEIQYPSWLFSRAMKEGSRDFIAVWNA